MSKSINSTQTDTKDNYQAPTQQNQTTRPQQTTQPTQPVIVVQQPQQIVYAQPAQPQQVVYTQPATVQQPYNPNSVTPMQPGVLVVHPQAANTNIQEEQQPRNGDDAKEDEIYHNELKEKAKQGAKDAGKQAKKAGIAALGWMAKKMNELNDKVQEKEDVAAPNEGQEGNNANQK
eukprot:UN10694